MRVLATAKVRVVAPNPGHQKKLLAFLRAYRDWTQYVVDQIWGEKQIPSMRWLHHRFYHQLRSRGFRAHHCHKIERRAREVVKSARKNRGSKPVLKRLTARLGLQDYRFDPETKTLRIAVLNGEWVELRLEWYTYLDRYLDDTWRMKEIQVSYRNDEFWAYLVFEKQVKARRPKAVMEIDVNFDTIAYTIVGLDGKLITMGVMPFTGLRRALAHKIIAERTQKRYPKQWKHTKGIRKAIRRHGRRARNILIDTCHYLSRRLVRIASQHGALIVLEDLNKLRTRNNGSKKLNKKLSLWTYRRIQSYTAYKAFIEGLNVVHVDPRNTSRTSPVDGKLEFINYRWVRLPNGVITTRDVIASWNLALRGLNLLARDVGPRGSVEAPKAPDQMQTQEGMKGKPAPKASKIPQVAKIA